LEINNFWYNNYADCQKPGIKIWALFLVELAKQIFNPVGIAKIQVKIRSKNPPTFASKM
jgi:hypothetical protein